MLSVRRSPVHRRFSAPNRKSQDTLLRFSAASCAGYDSASAQSGLDAVAAIIPRPDGGPASSVPIMPPLALAPFRGPLKGSIFIAPFSQHSGNETSLPPAQASAAHLPPGLPRLRE